MKKTLLLMAMISLAFVSCKNENQEVAGENTETAQQIADNKIVSLNGGLTEILSALGLDDQIVGRDVTSTYPETVKAKATDLGHVRSLTIEPIMALNPTLIIASDSDINPELMAKIKESGIKTETYSQDYSINGTKKLIATLADHFGVKDFQPVIDKIDADLAQMQTLETKPKVLFIYARGQMLMVAGKNTPMESLISIAGGENAVNDFEDFKPLTPEALIQGNPDVILFFDSGLESAGGVDAVLKVPGVAQTKAGKNKAIVSMDGGLMTSFGPRVGEAALTLNKLLVGSAK